MPLDGSSKSSGSPQLVPHPLFPEDFGSPIPSLPITRSTDGFNAGGIISNSREWSHITAGCAKMFNDETLLLLPVRAIVMSTEQALTRLGPSGRTKRGFPLSNLGVPGLVG